MPCTDHFLEMTSTRHCKILQQQIELVNKCVALLLLKRIILIVQKREVPISSGPFPEKKKGRTKKANPLKEDIRVTAHESEEFISQMFIRPKKDGTYRLILNPKKFNKFVKYHHFKMENIHTATELMNKNFYMASVDLQDVYYSVPVCKNHQKYPCPGETSCISLLACRMA